MPAFAISAARMPPDQPTPMITASTSLLATTLSSIPCGVLIHLSGKALWRHVVGVVELVNIGGIRVAIGHGVAGEPHPLPADHVVIAAVDRVREESFLHVLEEHGKELVRR